MAKHEDNAVIALLIFFVLILTVLLAYTLLRLMTTDKQLEHHQREANKSALVLRDEREKLEKLLKSLKVEEKEE
jgi:energy-converting hydrogenase Eha subunit H